jgi:hypothetical protein
MPRPLRGDQKLTQINGLGLKIPRLHGDQKLTQINGLGLKIPRFLSGRKLGNAGQI